YVQKNATENPASASDSFDDYVRFKERWQMQDTNDGYVPAGASCTPGFRIDGYRSGEHSGESIARGDVNCNGKEDLIIGAPDAAGGGRVYVVFGTASGLPNPLPLNTLNGTNGFVITDSPWNTAIGKAVAVGNVN